VGLIGTTTPAFRSEGVFQDAGSDLHAEASGVAAEAPAAGGEAGAPAPSTEEATSGEALSGGDALSPAESNEERAFAASSDDVRDDGDDASTRLSAAPAERSPWPMVLFTGVALMVAAALLRWILVPRAG
jgi:hypothetical protein